MTLNGAIMQLVEMRENSMMPVVFKPYFDKVIETISECVEPSEIPHWIPCSERLPDTEYEESKSVLVCLENGTQDVLYFDGGNWCYPTGETYVNRNYKNGWHNEVIAWIPLPEPYQAERRTDDGE